MPCYRPLIAWRGNVLPSGKREILFKQPKFEAASLYQLKLPCGQCIGCRLERSRQWAMRCVHEASLYDHNSFITLTYDDAHLPESGTLVKQDFQKFMKWLRKSIYPERVRFFHCGEYGDKYQRPHYHSIVFGYDFADKQIYRKTERGDTLYTSNHLSTLWPMGHAMLGAVTFESAAYVARYCLKKITGKTADAHYANKTTGELRLPEYVTMSRRPGIGKQWYEKYFSDIYPRDYAIIRGMKVRPPKYYDGLYELSSPLDFSCMKQQRKINALKIDPTGNGETGDLRLRVKEEVKLAQLRSLSRNLEE